MSTGFEENCLCCRREISEFTDRIGIMRCPRAHDKYDAICSLMPNFKTESEMEEAIVILKNGGYEISGRSFDGNTKFYPIIPIIRDLAERLMRYEPVNGALHHDSGVVCKKCVENLSHCQECGEKRVPLCPVCKAELVCV